MWLRVDASGCGEGQRLTARIENAQLNSPCWIASVYGGTGDKCDLGYTTEHCFLKSQGGLACRTASAALASKDNLAREMASACKPLTPFFRMSRLKDSVAKAPFLAQ